MVAPQVMDSISTPMRCVIYAISNGYREYTFTVQWVIMVRGVFVWGMLLGLFAGPALAVSIDYRADDLSVFTEYPRGDARTVTTTLAEDSYSVQCFRADMELWPDGGVENHSYSGESITETGITPVPEPGAFVLVALGAATLLIRFWRNLVG